ncbi:type IV secretion system protein B10, putative [Erythrobacter litoralis HTCC2594]|uniref:Type IV secretion system protein B10, putative n=2 Tax=Erythrobacter litoralis TaxID=39960 RepID=Q2NC51_ERYLH|nr:type IV secretion system protein B10, putative [Erythrobacter litoralis HTCC2594]
MRLPDKDSGSFGANDVDPRETQDADVTDLASRTSYPAVANKGGKSDAMGLVAGIAIVAALGAVTFWSMNAAQVPPPEGVGSAQVEQAPVQAQAPQQAVAPAPVAAPRPDPAPAPVYAQSPDAVTVPRANPNASPSLVFDASARAAGPEAAVAPGTASALPGGGNASGNSANDFASRVGGVGGGPAQAARMVNPATTVTQGTLIPAILETAIDTDVPGFVRAVVSQDVRSFDGKNVLVPRSSRLVGQYQSGVQGGQKRAYVIWTRLIRPDGVSVPLQSPAIGFDGTTGLRGDVNSRFFQRFGSAMLLSVVGGLGAIASGGASVVIGGAGQSAAAAAVQQDSQVGPVIRVRQGEPIRVFTARDLDFSTVM